MSAYLAVRCSSSACWCCRLPSIRTIFSTGQLYTVQDLPWSGAPWLFRYLYTEVAA